MNFMSSLALAIGTAVIATTIVQMAWTTVRQWRFAPKSPATASLQHQRIDEVTPGPGPLSSRRIHHANPQI